MTKQVPETKGTLFRSKMFSLSSKRGYVEDKINTGACTVGLEIVDIHDGPLAL